MPSLRSIRRVLVVAPVLCIIAAGCGGDNESRVTPGTSTAPEASLSTDEALKRPPTPTKKAAPAGYPGGRR